ncbi:hypothetical protein CR513_20480, partial [Mucuna pruriens]
MSKLNILNKKNHFEPWEQLVHREDTRKIKPTTPTEHTCHAIAVQTKVITYATCPFWKPSISPCKVLHSPLAKRPMMEAQVAMSAVYICISKTTENVSFFRTFSKDSCMRESKREYTAEAPRVHRKPTIYFPLETPDGSPLSSLTARSAADKVITTVEFIIKAVNF